MKKRFLGSTEIAEICQVTPPTIWRWMKEGKLPYFTTAGGHCRVWTRDLVSFLKERNIPVPRELEEPVSNLILIVDDEVQVRSVIRRALRKMVPEAEIREAVDGYEAGHQTALEVPSLVILDIRLPGMDGYKVCRMIRADPRLKNTKILAISGHNVEESRKQSLSAGADDFLGKPFDAQGLKETVARIMEK